MIVFEESKKERLQKEFEEDIDNRLKIILFALAGYLEYKREEDLIITHLMRTQKEQDAIYTSDKVSQEIREKYIKNPFYSVHQFGRGADVGITNIQKAKEIIEWLNTRFVYDGRYKTAILHDIGLGKHIHIQVNNLWFLEVR